jgi:hypothetical protein
MPSAFFRDRIFSSAGCIQQRIIGAQNFAGLDHSV